MMFCPKCGTQVDESAQFCQKCGTAVTPTGQAPAPSGKNKSGGRTAMLVGWLLVLAALGIVFAPVPSEVSLLLSFVLSWIGLTLVFPGASVIIRAGKGFVGAIVVSFAVFYVGDMVSSHFQQPAADALKVELGTLLVDYKMNEVGADQQYKGHVIETRGYVKEVKKDVLNNPYVLITGLELPGNMASSGLQCSLSETGAKQAAKITPLQEVAVQGKVTGLMVFVQATDCIFVTTPGNAAPQSGTTAAPPVASQAATPAPPAQPSEGIIEADCEVVRNGQTLTPTCEAVRQADGTFNIRNPMRSSELIDGILEISVEAVETGHEVRILTAGGVRSWGLATRESEDPSCWKGSDVRVCARPKGR